MYDVLKSFSALTLKGKRSCECACFFLCRTAMLLLRGPRAKLALGGLGVIEIRLLAPDGLLLIVTIVIPLQLGADSWHCVELRL